MKNKIWLLLPIVLVGCSKISPLNPVLVEPPETKEVYAIKQQANALLNAREFDKLDAAAKAYRDSKVCFPNGRWKLSYFYDGLDSSVGNGSDADWTNHLSLIMDWIRAEPKSMTARVALANGLIDYAWQARGHDYANKVTEEGWIQFFRRLNAAVEVLGDARALDQKSPYWWMAMLRAELGLQAKRSQYDATFNAAIAAWPDYTPFYFHRSDYLLPRWYGAEGELEKDLEQSADKVGGEAGDMLYARVVWNLHGMVYSQNMFEEYHLSWERTKRGMEAIEKHYPDSLAVKNEMAHLAALAGDWQTAKTYFQRTKGRIDISCWSSTNEYIACAKYVYGVKQ